MEKDSASDRRAKGIPREELQGKLQDPTGVDIWAANDQQMPAGGEGLEGGAAGKFTRSFREGGESARSGGSRHPTTAAEAKDERPGDR